MQLVLSASCNLFYNKPLTCQIRQTADYTALWQMWVSSISPNTHVLHILHKDLTNIVFVATMDGNNNELN